MFYISHYDNMIMYYCPKWWFSKVLVHDPHCEIHFVLLRKSTQGIHIHRTQTVSQKQYLFLLHAVQLAIFLLYFITFALYFSLQCLLQPTGFLGWRGADSVGARNQRKAKNLEKYIRQSLESELLNFRFSGKGNSLHTEKEGMNMHR